MNTANLQLEGVYAILAALLGAVSSEEIDRLLADVETTLVSDTRRPVELRDANVEAICFPARFLRHALKASSEGRAFSLAQLASEVGHRKQDG